MNGRALVTVNVTVEVGCWGEDCTVKQAYEQGAVEAERKIRALLLKEHGVSVSGVSCTRVVVDAPKKEG